ncbi:GDP-mannose 4,6-dehydratase [Alphaproteobacteria bacterium]|nr:GDP-mannose 4,6-dehydratase [Alphaproteobacteria bacterium]
MKMKILITGVAGFIGMAVARKLLAKGISIIGIDNLNNYYDVNLKNSRLHILKKYKNFKFYKQDILSKRIPKIFETHKPSKIIHLAAQPGVRYSIIKPNECTEININGFLNILNLAKDFKVENFVYASSSSVYGANEKIPYSEDQKNDSPVSLYAATKKSNELFAHTYSSLYGLKTTGLRYFTVYGPWGRPDMAAMSFINKIINNQKIDVYNNGDMKRDFTYIDDITEGTINALNLFNHSKRKNIGNFNIFNLGNSKPTNLLIFIKIIEEKLKMKAKINFLPMQLGDVKNTYADINKSKKLIYYQPHTSINSGIEKLVEWYKNYYLDE